jgi:biopolymer transport protein ExbD
MKRFDQINVIPFIDIMLVLLAIVLTTATFIVQGHLDVTLPRADSAKAPASTPELTLGIDRDGVIYRDDQATSLEALEAELAQLAKSTRIALRVDVGVLFGRFVDVIDLLKAQGLANVSIVTRR